MVRDCENLMLCSSLRLLNPTEDVLDKEDMLSLYLTEDLLPENLLPDDLPPEDITANPSDDGPGPSFSFFFLPSSSISAPHVSLQ